MDETDAFFTHTIVGSPFSVLLGRRQTLSRVSAQGLKVDPGTGDARLCRLWQEWALLNHACDPLGQPRRRPGRVRRVLERHALWIALVGVLALLGTAVFWGIWLWS